jgi:hypothetical protein
MPQALGESWIWPAAIGTIGLVVVLLIFSVPAIQARRRGYSFIVWFFAGLLVYNPIYLLIVLATIPHRARQEQRLQFAAELDARLSAAGIPVVTAVRPIPDRSLGDFATIDPRTTAGKFSDAKSIGDEPTRQ